MRTGREVIVVAPTNYRDCPVGGTLTFLRNVLPHLDVPVRLVGVSACPKPGLKGWQQVNVGGRWFPFWPLYDTSAREFGMPFRVRSVAHLWRQKGRIVGERASLVYVHSAEMGFPFLARRRSWLVFHMHGEGLPRNVPRFSRFRWTKVFPCPQVFELLYRAVLRRADRILVVSKAGLQVCCALGYGYKTTCVPVCVDTDLFLPLNGGRERRKAFGIKDDDIVVLFVGRLARAKNLPLLLKSFSIAQRHRRVSKLVLVGGGPEEKALRILAIQLGIEKHTIFVGEKLQRDLPVFYSMADVTALTSESEGFPTVVLESFACGTPVVARDVAGARDVIQDHITGYLVRETSPDAFAGKLEAGASLKTRARQALLSTARLYSATSTATKISGILTESLSKYVRLG